MRFMGLDYGSKTVGVAISDGLNLTAQGKEIIRRESETKLRRTLARIEVLIEAYDVGQIVLGLPLHMDGSESERVRLTKQFRDALVKRTGLPVHLQDERLSSVEAEEILRESGMRKDDQKAYVDMLAAEIILQDFLNQRERNGDG